MTEKMLIGHPEIVLVRYGELALKGGNRRLFERALCRNIQAAVRDITEVRIERASGRIALHAEERVDAVARRVQDVFGIKSVSPAWGTESTLTSIEGVARSLTAQAFSEVNPKASVSFRVRTRRADKRFPMTSTEVDRHIGDAVLEGSSNVHVRLKGAEIELGIEIRDERTYLFTQRLPGRGGLPVGTLGRALCLLSGGIDSPVAAWLAMKRGCDVGFVSFHSFPYIGEGSKKKIVDLVRALDRYQPKSRLFVVPFTEVQTAIRDEAPESYRTVLYRRMMQRIATRIAEEQGYQALVTGECLGQVASQTMENLTCIGAASGLPVLRPVLCHDKEETIAIAETIGTFEVSKRPEPDCCTVFQPRRPVIYGKLEACLEAEARFDVEGLIERAFSGIEIIGPRELVG